MTSKLKGHAIHPYIQPCALPSIRRMNEWMDVCENESVKSGGFAFFRIDFDGNLIVCVCLLACWLAGMEEFSVLLVQVYTIIDPLKRH